MKLNVNALRLAHFCLLALFSWVGGQWLLVYAGWTQPWMAYSVSCTAVTQFSNLVLKLLLDDSNDDNTEAPSSAAPKDRTVNNKKNKKKKAVDNRDVTE